jgi:demethylmenaquinone methyltransferase/2-methoxy-6-polyprenyl-1,4-benzoquinol methylase
LSGLGEKYWNEVIEVLRSIIPVYDRVNSTISLGKDMDYRRMGIRRRVFSGDIILDAGSGYGNMSRLAVQEADGQITIFMYDPLIDMLKKARVVFNSQFRGDLASGVFEYFPFQDKMFDVILCGYSLRDAIDLELAIFEMHRVLRNGGRLIIVDLGKPDNFLTRFVISFYLKYVLGILAFGVAGRMGLKFRTLYGTYQRWPKNSDLCTLLNEKFSKVEFNTKLMGGAIIVTAYK